jgi:hypothetical protein
VHYCTATNTWTAQGGANGESAQPAWADDDSGTGCTLASPGGKTHVAFLITNTPRGALTCADYSGETWTQFKGEAGASGTSATIADPVVITGDPGSPAVVEDLDPDPSIFEPKFTIPTGAAGSEGPAGPSGPPGTEYSNTFTGTSASVTAATHGCGANPKVIIRSSGGADITDNVCSYEVDGSGNVSITCGASVTSAKYVITGGSPATGNTAATAGFLLFELGANGSDYAGVYARDSITSSWCISLPLVAPTTGQVLTATGSTASTTDGKTCVVMEWQ